MINDLEKPWKFCECCNAKWTLLPESNFLTEFYLYYSSGHFVGSYSRSAPESQTSKLRGASSRGLFQRFGVLEIELLRIGAPSQWPQLPHVRTWSTISTEVRWQFDQSRSDTRGTALCGCRRSAEISSQAKRQTTQQRLAQR